MPLLATWRASFLMSVSIVLCFKCSSTLSWHKFKYIPLDKTAQLQTTSRSDAISRVLSRQCSRFPARPFDSTPKSVANYVQVKYLSANPLEQYSCCLPVHNSKPKRSPQSTCSTHLFSSTFVLITVHLTWPHSTLALPHYHASKETEVMQTFNAYNVK